MPAVSARDSTVQDCCWVRPILNTARRNPGGCLMVQGALAYGEAADSIRQELTACRAAGEAAMRRVSNVRNQKVTYQPMRTLLILLATSRCSSTEWQFRHRAAQAELNYSA